MAKINPCFRRTFVFFNVLFAILGVVFIGLGLMAHFQLREEEGNKLTGVICMVVVGAVIFILSVLGAYGAQKENKNVLIAFFVIMCMGTIVLLRLAIPVAMSRNEVIPMLEKEFQTLVPLNKADKDFQHTLQYFQEQANCCGLFNGYQDWGNDVPASCDCADVEPDQCRLITQTNNNYLISIKNRKVYSQPCGPLIMGYINTGLNIALGVLFGFGSLAMLAAVMSLVMIIRITAPIPSPPPIFALDYKPPKYSELIPSA
ncbi:tetraspanin-8-like isoform X2 [Salminus brasiliensis]